MFMLIELIRWWYGPGWLLAFRRITGRTQGITRVFSISTLLGTLFSPWKRIVTDGAKGMDGKMKALLDNLISRIVGFTVRSMVLFAAVLVTAGSFVFGLLLAVVWPAIPALALYLAIRSIV